MSIRSPFSSKKERGGYSAIAYKDGDLFVAQDNEGTIIKEGTAAVVLQAALNAKKNVFLSEATFDIGSTTLTLQDKDNDICGEGVNSIIKGSADPLIDVTLTNEYQLRMQKLGIHTTSTNRGIFIDNCTSRLPVWLNNMHFNPEGHAGTLLHIKGLANAQISNCSFQDHTGATTAKGIYLTADSTIFTQELYLNACNFFHLNYGIQGYALAADRAKLAGIHVMGSEFFRNDYPIHFQHANCIAVVGSTIESPHVTGEEGIIFKDVLESRIVGNRLSTKSTTAQLQFIGENLDCYLNTVEGNNFTAYDRNGDGILLDCSPGNKFVGAMIHGNAIYGAIDAVQITKGTSYYPQVIFVGNHVFDCTWNLTGDTNHSVIVGNVWGSGCSSTVVNGSSGFSEIAHNHKS